MSYAPYQEWITTTFPIECHCLPIEIPACVESIYFPTIYIESQLLFYFIDKFDKEYIYLAKTDEQGWAEIDTSWFPPALFNPYAGKFSVFFTSSLAPKAERGYFRAPDKLYACLEISVIDTVYTNIEPFGQHYADLKKYYCCCERHCPLPQPDCSNPNTLTFNF